MLWRIRRALRFGRIDVRVLEQAGEELRFEHTADGEIDSRLGDAAVLHNRDQLRKAIGVGPLDVDPGVVTVKTGLKSPIGRLALANSISLTPGSLVLDISEEGLTVHCLDMRTIDANDPSRTIARPFEKYLEKSFG